jgi:excisionase family DNA binding protein
MLPEIPSQSFQTSELQPLVVQDELQLLTVAEAAALLHCHWSTIYRMMQSGEMTHIKFGRSRRLRRSDLETFISSHVKSARG